MKKSEKIAKINNASIKQSFFQNILSSTLYITHVPACDITFYILH